MTIETFIITWNRKDLIDFTVRYYLRLGAVTVYDNYSTDETPAICRNLGATVKHFGIPGQLNDQEYLNVKNHCWKQSKADWVIVVDDDEILWHPNLLQQLEYAIVATIIRPQGIGIFSNDLPKEEWTEIMTGVIDNNYSKLCCFRPRDLEEIGYIFGCHQAKPKGRIRMVDKLFLLHYKAVGGADYLIERHKLYSERKKSSVINNRWGLGSQYDEDPEKTRSWFNQNLANSKILPVPGTGGQ